MVSKLETIEMQCFQGKELDSGPTIGVSTQNPETRGTTVHVVFPASAEAADRMADMKKQDMAEAAERLLVATGWLPKLMRTPGAAQERAEPPQADVVTGTSPDAYSVAAE